jgi:hypothetical protein
VKQVLLAPSSGQCLYAYDLIHCLLVLDRVALVRRAEYFCRWLDQCVQTAPRMVGNAVRAAAAWLAAHPTLMTLAPVCALVATYTARPCGRPDCRVTSSTSSSWIECTVCGTGQGGYCSAACQSADAERHARARPCVAVTLQRHAKEHDPTAERYPEPYLLLLEERVAHHERNLVHLEALHARLRRHM